MRLRDAQQQLLEQEKKSMEQTKLISELTTKVYIFSNSTNNNFIIIP